MNSKPQWAEVDEAFVAAFAHHRFAEGRRLSLQSWAATMREALAVNDPFAVATHTYNRFNVDEVANAFKAFSNLTFTPAREFAPVMLVHGPPDTLSTLAKLASKKLGAFEALFVTPNELRIAWD